MEKLARIPMLYWALGLFCFGLVLANSLFYLWVYPLDQAGLAHWLFIASLDAVLAGLVFPWVPRARILLWAGGLFFFHWQARGSLAGLVFGASTGGALAELKNRRAQMALACIAFDRACVWPFLRAYFAKLYCEHRELQA